MVISQVSIPRLLVAINNDKQLLSSLDNVQKYINSEDSLVSNILKFSLALRYLSNNQIILYASFLSA